MTMKLSAYNKRKWLENQINFSKPLILFVAMLYFPDVIAKLSQPDTFTFADFMPKYEILVATLLYLFNALYDFIRKWANQ